MVLYDEIFERKHFFSGGGLRRGIFLGFFTFTGKSNGLIKREQRTVETSGPMKSIQNTYCCFGGLVCDRTGLYVAKALDNVKVLAVFFKNAVMKE